MTVGDDLWLFGAAVLGAVMAGMIPSILMLIARLGTVLPRILRFHRVTTKPQRQARLDS